MKRGESIRSVVEFYRRWCTLELLSEHGCFGGRQFFYRHPSIEIGLPMRFALFVPPRASRAATADADVSRRAHVHRRNLHDQGRRAANCGPARYGAPDARHESTRRRRAGGEPNRGISASAPVFTLMRPASLGSKHWRMESYLMGELLPLVIERVFDRSVADRRLRSFDGRPRRVDTRAAASGPLRFGLGVRADRCADAGTVGKESV